MYEYGHLGQGRGIIPENKMIEQKINILVVDDDEDILTACRLLLKKHFDKVVTCNKPEFIPLLMVLKAG